MTKTLSAIKQALNKGYKIDTDGIITGLRGNNLVIKLRGNQRYPTFPVNIDGKVFGIPVHQFAAYCFYGEKPKGLVVRHLNGNTCDNSKQNICYGTPSENNRDKPKAVRVAAAKLANAAQTRHPSLKLSDEQIKAVAEEYIANGYRFADGRAKELAELYGVNRNTVTSNAKRFLQSRQML